MSESGLDQNRFRRPFGVLLATVFVITFFKGFRLPSLWPATHFAFNYSFGFVRRGLVGEVARRLFGNDVYKYHNFLAFALGSMAVLAVLLAQAIIRALRLNPNDWGLRVALLLFGVSPGLVFFVHMVGYFDYVGAIGVLGLCFAAMRIQHRFAPAYLALVLGALLVLIHEGLAVMFVPSIFFVLLCHAVRGSLTRSIGKWEWAALAAHGVLATAPFLLAAVVLSASGTQDGERVRALVAFVQKHADFPIRADAVEVLTRSSAANMRVIVPWYWAQPLSRQLAFANFSAFLPGFALILYYGVVSIRRIDLPRVLSWLLLAAFLAAALCPQLLNFVGWDWPRWNGISLVQSVVCLLSVKLLLPQKESPEISDRFLTLGVVFTAIGLASTAFLFDDYRVQFFPFENQLDLLLNMFKGKFILRPHG
jgi:hypothetical protein